MHFNTKNEVGNRYGRWVVLEFSKSSSRGAFWKCRCECGKEVVVLGSSLRHGDTKSCGCLRRESISKILWKGGINNPGSLAWVNSRLSVSRVRSRKQGYKPVDMTSGELIAEFENHHGCCDICGISEKECQNNLSIDHCHQTGKFRGFLCRACNHLLGNAKDDIYILRRAADYLKRARNT